MALAAAGAVADVIGLVSSVIGIDQFGRT